ncbi:nucleoside transporter [Salmonella enterica]|nr:nucleoside transporter [Salmonella enterica]
MKEGIYNIVFESNQQSVGEGIGVVSGGRIYGGDIGFTCRGVLTLSYLEMEVCQYNPDVPSVFGMQESYNLEMHYQEVGEGQYHFNGHVKGYPEKRMTARALFLAPLLG